MSADFRQNPHFKSGFSFKILPLCCWSFLTKNLLHKWGLSEPGVHTSSSAAGWPHLPLARSSRCVSYETAPTHELPAPFQRRDVQRRTRKVIDSSDFLLFPPVAQERSGEGRGVSTEDNFGAKIFSQRSVRRNKNTQRGSGRNTFVCRCRPPVPGPFLAALAALRLASSLSHQPFSQRCCVTGKGAEPDQPPLPLHRAHTGAAFRGCHWAPTSEGRSCMFYLLIVAYSIISTFIFNTSRLNDNVFNTCITSFITFTRTFSFYFTFILL